MNVRIPFYPAVDYAHISPAVGTIISELPNPPEGHLSPQQTEYLYRFIRLIKPEFVAETGLGVGHSASIVLCAQESVGIKPRMLSVDSCQFAETRVAANYLKGRFPGFRFVERDSKEVLSAAVHGELRSTEGVQLSIALVDGGHDVVSVGHDLETFRSFLTVGGFLWLDDFEKIVPNSGVNQAGAHFARQWGSCHRFRSSGNRGIML